jgi:hypothetical protein
MKELPSKYMVSDVSMSFGSGHVGGKGVKMLNEILGCNRDMFSWVGIFPISMLIDPKSIQA